MMDCGALPPEVNSARMYAGPGSGPLRAAAAAWSRLADELSTAATGVRAVVDSIRWQGPSAVAMRGAVLKYTVWLAATAETCAGTGAQVLAAVEAYEAAHAATVPPALVGANRAQLAALVATNVFGQNAPAIAANEAHYVAMWAQDAAAMYAYASATAGIRLEPFTAAPGTVGGSSLQQIVGALLGQPESGGIAGWLSGITSGGQGLGLNANFWNTVMSTGAFNPLQIAQLAASFGTLGAVEQIATATAATAAPPAPAAVPRVEAPPRAAVGGGTTIRGLSVPPSWAQQMRPAAGGVSITTAAGAPGGVMPVPPAVPVAGRGPRRARKPDPEYGDVPKVMPRPPAGG
ncbi:PPE family protein [Mycobacterium eburneum]|nr:PPE family protein [Mycobacterium eburneum]